MRKKVTEGSELWNKLESVSSFLIQEGITLRDTRYNGVIIELSNGMFFRPIDTDSSNDFKETNNVSVIPFEFDVKYMLCDMNGNLIDE